MTPISPATLGGSPVKMHLYVDDVDAVFEQAVAAGAKIIRPVEDQFYGDRSGQLSDPFGYTWTVASHQQDVVPRRNPETLYRNVDAATEEEAGGRSDSQRLHHAHHLPCGAGCGRPDRFHEEDVRCRGTLPQRPRLGGRPALRSPHRRFHADGGRWRRGNEVARHAHAQRIPHLRSRLRCDLRSCSGSGSHFHPRANRSALRRALRAA